jgi:hypothetical protein
MGDGRRVRLRIVWSSIGVLAMLAGQERGQRQELMKKIAHVLNAVLGRCGSRGYCRRSRRPHVTEHPWRSTPSSSCAPRGTTNAPLRCIGISWQRWRAAGGAWGAEVTTSTASTLAERR